MQSKSPVEMADLYSRRRAIVGVLATFFFLLPLAIRPFSDASPDAARQSTLDTYWAINAIVLLVVLATGGGLLNRRAIRALVNDEVSRIHYRQALVAGFWVAMAAAFTVFFVPMFRISTARFAVYAIVTSSLAVALFWFCWLELRAHRDG